MAGFLAVIKPLAATWSNSNASVTTACMGVVVELISGACAGVFGTVLGR